MKVQEIKQTEPAAIFSPSGEITYLPTSDNHLLSLANVNDDRLIELPTSYSPTPCSSFKFGSPSNVTQVQLKYAVFNETLAKYGVISNEENLSDGSINGILKPVCLSSEGMD